MFGVEKPMRDVGLAIFIICFLCATTLILLQPALDWRHGRQIPFDHNDGIQLPKWIGNVGLGMLGALAVFSFLSVLG